MYLMSAQPQIERSVRVFETTLSAAVRRSLMHMTQWLIYVGLNFHGLSFWCFCREVLKQTQTNT